LSSGLVRALSAVGFRPVHSENVGTVLKIGWLLAIAGFRPLELLGCLIYIWTSPLILVAYLVFRDLLRELHAPVSEKVGLRPARSRSRALNVASLALVGWYVLYSEATDTAPLIVGAVVVGVLFSLLLWVAFQRIRPVNITDSQPASILERIGLSLLEGVPANLERVRSSEKRQDTIVPIFLFERLRRFYRSVSLLIRGQGGKDRLYLALLLEYVISLILLGAIAILFWAIAMKAAIAPSSLSIREFLDVAVAYFVPSFSRLAVPFPIPLWVSFGENATAVLLFVLYVGAAASILPSRQRAYAERLGKKYRIYRLYSLQFKRAVKTLEKMKSEFKR
jgi:hypothetical protein